MWVFTTQGFLSVVQHNSMPDHFQIKSRVRDPLSALWPDHEIEVIDWADYRYRITIHKEEALPVLIGVIQSIDYTGFKGACHGSPRYHDVLVWVWRIMHEYQASNEVER